MGVFTLTLSEAMEFEPDIGLNDYPIFDETYRERLNKKIIDFYLNREIGQETISLFKQRLQVRMNNIMPKYNAIYEATAKGIDPFVTFRTKTQSSQSGRGNSSVNETSHAKQDATVDSVGRSVTSEFPQQTLSDTGDYANGSADSTSKSDNVSVSDTEGDRTVTDQTSGSMDALSEGFSGGSMADMLLNFADSFFNTDLEIIRELGNLFMLVWDNGDSYTTMGPTRIGGMYW